MALARPDRYVIQIFTPGVGDDLTHFNGSARRCINFMLVMSLEYLNVIAGVENAGSDIQQFERGVNTDAHIWGKHYPNGLRRFVDSSFAGVIKTGCANDYVDTVGLTSR